MENVAIPGNFVFRERWPLVVVTPGCLQDCLLPVQCTVMCVAAQGKAHELRTVGKNYVLRMIERLIQVALFSYFARAEPMYSVPVFLGSYGTQTCVF